jgi:ribosomal protein L35
MKAKTTKSVSKRIKITKTGKMIHRSMGVNHFKSKKNGKQIRQKRKTHSLDYSKRRILNY